jgi:hypothetical protein
LFGKQNSIVLNIYSCKTDQPEDLPIPFSINLDI